MDFGELSAQRYQLARTPELWQFDLLTPQKLRQFAHDLKIHVLNAKTVTGLWRTGLLRADYIASPTPLNEPSLHLLSHENGVFVYCDRRPVKHRPDGYGGTLEFTEPSDEDLELLFHPFRLYVLYHVERVFSSHATPTQFLLHPDGILNIGRNQISNLHSWTSSAACAECFERWNTTAELAILLEPIAYEEVFNTIRWRLPDTQQSLQAKTAGYRNQVNKLLSDIAIDEVNDVRQHLCQDASLLDKNKLLHVLLRLMSQHERLKLRDSLGACMLFLCMAEVIRRAFESASGRELPEEDELGFGQWMEGARKSIYGTERIFDSTRETRRDLLTSMGLDVAVKARCYVEGSTEIGALVSAVGDTGGTEFINLRGQVIERRGKGLSFLDSLKNDRKAHVFSVVLLDEDRGDYIRVLKKAAKDEVFFGRFFIASPDFEFSNFEVKELVNVLLQIASQMREQVPSIEEILPTVSGTKSAKEFFGALKRNGFDDLSELGKNEEWGQALMIYALQNPNRFQDGQSSNSERQVVDIARLLIRARRSGYLRSLERYRVDPETGQLIEK